MRGFRDRDFVATPEGLLFCVVGNVHPKERVISYLKYVPSPAGRWGRKERYDRSMTAYTMPMLLRNIDNLEREYPAYVFHSDVFGVKMSAVPKVNVAVHFRPEEKLQELLRAEHPDSLQWSAVELVLLLSELSDVPPDFFGVTGSILLGIHREEFSDVDLTVYGYSQSLKVKESLVSAFSADGASIARLPAQKMEEWAEEKSRDYPISLQAARSLYNRKWNYGMFRDRIFSVHPVRVESEVGEEYGDRRFLSDGMVTVEATVVETPESLFLPCTYQLENSRVIEGKAIAEPKELTSYEGFYGGFLSTGEAIRASGKLERVVDRRGGGEYHRILVGSPEAGGRDYILPRSLLGGRD